MKTFNKEEYTEKHMKLKLHPNEVVKPESFIEACLCCELVDRLGFAWNDSDSYLKVIYYNVGGFYDFEEGTWDRLRSLNPEFKTISAIEFLNRHDVFVHEQKVIANNGLEGWFLCGVPELSIVAIDSDTHETTFRSPFDAFEPRIKEEKEPEPVTQAINPAFTKYSKLREKFMELAKEMNELTSVVSDYEKEQ